MLIEFARSRSIPLAALCMLATTAQAQNCSGTITANVNVVSASFGGTQTLTMSVAPNQSGEIWQLLGALGDSNPDPYLLQGGLRLDQDRYLIGMVRGGRGFVQGGLPTYLGVWIPWDSQGHAQLDVVIPPGLPSILIGKTLHHGIFTTSHTTLMPICGTPTVPLLIVP